MDSLDRLPCLRVSKTSTVNMGSVYRASYVKSYWQNITIQSAALICDVHSDLLLSVGCPGNHYDLMTSLKS